MSYYLYIVYYYSFFIFFSLVYAIYDIRSFFDKLHLNILLAIVVVFSSFILYYNGYVVASYYHVIS